MNNFGLKPKTRDIRDLKVASIFNLPKLEELPPVFSLQFPSIVDQKDSDFCAAAASCALSEIQEGIPLSFEWTFAVAKMIEGNDVDSFGLELRDVCKAHVKYGAIERSEAPFSLENKPHSFLRRIENWPSDLFKKAKKHKKGSYFDVVGQYDAYDDIRASMWKFRDKKCGVIFGVIWSWALSQTLIETPNENGGGHAIAGIGWDENGMFIQNSYGESVGTGGRHYFSRDVINAFAEKFGCYMFLDISKEDARYYEDNGVKVEDNWFVAFIKTIVTVLKDLILCR